MIEGQPRGTIGIRELKSRLSEYLVRVQAGEQLTITDRGRPVATITGIEAIETPAWVSSMVQAHRAGWAGGKPAGMRTRIPRRGTPASEMVRQDRR